MAINTFSTLKSAVADWLDRDDIGNAIDNMIGLMESRLYSQLRVRGKEHLHQLKPDSRVGVQEPGLVAEAIPNALKLWQAHLRGALNNDNGIRAIP